MCQHSSHLAMDTERWQTPKDDLQDHEEMTILQHCLRADIQVVAIQW